MPELPEVETLRLQLSQLLPDLAVKSIDILKPKSFVGDEKYVIREKIIGVRRFAKILVIDLSNGLSLAIHLKMSGQLIYKRKAESVKGKVKEENKHTRIIISFTNGDRLFFNDMRMFGWIKVIQNAKFKMQNDNAKIKIPQLNDLIKNLGPEPLRDLTIKKFKEILLSTNRLIKLVLMDQEKISGVGNIYANDALFLAGIHPKTSANKLLNGQMVKLFVNLIKVLKDGLKWRGASRHHFRDAFGRKGEAQEHFYVYDRERRNCPNKCGENIKRIKLGGRGTFYCPKCQSES